jgi:uncharacterized protein YecE (DUF72 family)
MSQLPLFPSHDPPVQAARLRTKLLALAERRVYFGTSSWKYEGWLGTIYSPDRYETRGTFSRKRFEAECLAEYAETFPVVCGDFAFYQFPTPEYWKRLFGETPASLHFAFKVPEEITVAKWPGHARYGTRAGKENEGFLHGEMFQALFARRLDPYISRVATLIFEFGTFTKATFSAVDDFLARLEPFLSSLPEGYRYSVEIRNPEYLKPPYFTLLRSYGVAHVLNAWTRMPELSRQIEISELEASEFTVVRALLARGRSYEQAVREFEPYELIREPNQPARDAMAEVARRAIARRRPAFLFVNNRLEGHAPTTIEAVVDQIEF